MISSKSCFSSVQNLQPLSQICAGISFAMPVDLTNHQQRPRAVMPPIRFQLHFQQDLSSIVAFVVRRFHYNRRRRWKIARLAATAPERAAGPVVLAAVLVQRVIADIVRRPFSLLRAISHGRSSFAENKDFMADFMDAGRDQNLENFFHSGEYSIFFSG